MSLSRHRVVRSVYSTINLASDLGGLFTVVRAFCIIILIASNSYGSYHFLMAELFVNSMPEVKMNSGENLGIGRRGTQMRSYKHRLEPTNDVQWNTLKSMLITI